MAEGEKSHNINVQVKGSEIDYLLEGITKDDIVKWERQNQGDGGIIVFTVKKKDGRLYRKESKPFAAAEWTQLMASTPKEEVKSKSYKVKLKNLNFELRNYFL